MNAAIISRKNTENQKITEIPQDSVVGFSMPQNRNNTLKQNNTLKSKDDDFSYGLVDIYNKCCLGCKYGKNYTRLFNWRKSII